MRGRTVCAVEYCCVCQEGCGSGLLCVCGAMRCVVFYR